MMKDDKTWDGKLPRKGQKPGRVPYKELQNRMNDFFHVRVQLWAAMVAATGGYDEKGEYIDPSMKKFKKEMDKISDTIISMAAKGKNIKK